MYLLISYVLGDTYILISKVPILVTSLIIVTVNIFLVDAGYQKDFSSVPLLLTAALVEFLGFAARAE